MGICNRTGTEETVSETASGASDEDAEVDGVAEVLEAEAEAEVLFITELAGTMYISVRSVSDALSTKGESPEPVLSWVAASTREAIRCAGAVGSATSL